MNQSRNSRDADVAELVVGAPGRAAEGPQPLPGEQVEAKAWFSSAAARYAFAVVSVVAAVLASKTATAFLQVEPYVSLFLCSIMLVGWLAGSGPGLLATALSILAFDYFILPPIHSLTLEPNQLPRLALFILAAVFVYWISATQRSATRSLQRSRNELLAALEGQRQVEAQLMRSEMYLAEAQRLSRTGSFGWNVDSGELIWSAETFRIFGISPSMTPTVELVIDRVHPDDRGLVRGRIDRASVDGQDFDYEFRLLLPDGPLKHVRAIGHAATVSPGGFIGAVTDVTISKQIERELRTNEQRFRDFAETASDWFWETDRDHRLISVSREVKAVYGRIGARPWDFAADREEEPEKWAKHFAILQGREPFRDFRFRTVQGNGASVYMSVSGKPLFDSNGDFSGYRGVASNITAAIRGQQAEAALHNAQRDLEHAARVIALGELTTSIAHEVNQPLAAILSNAEACLRWLDRGADHLGSVRRSVDWIVKDVNRAAEVIKRVRSLARKTDVERSVFNLNDVAVDVGTLLQRELAENRVRLRLDLSPESLMVRADKVQLQQVVMNLLMNGMEAMQSVKDRPRELLMRSRRDQDGCVSVFVEDCGVGFSTEDANRLFNAFFTTKSSGLGLGLSICRTIVESHGGRLSAMRRVEGGSAFQFTLPVHQAG